jgi:spermidine synthase
MGVQVNPVSIQATLPVDVTPQIKTTPAWPFLLYGLTGFTGVLAEQGFEKYLSLLVGATAAASAAVIATYFLGFALGSWLIGAMIRSGRLRYPLRTYGWLELLIGASCVLFAYMFHPITGALAPWQSIFSSSVAKFAVRFGLGSLLILPTAALMGASFPLIAHVVDRGNASHGHSWLRAYASNLTGAIVAALSGAYVILPWIGIRGAFWLCFVICALVFAVCFAAGRREEPLSVSAEDRPSANREALDRDGWMLLTGAFVSGFMFFALEVLWTHLIAAAIGSSIYAFSAMLTMVLVGLFIGAFRVDRLASSKISYSRIFQFSALLLVIQLRLWDYGQVLFLVKLPPVLSNFYGAEAFKLALAALLIVPSAAMLGSIYPCLLRSPVLERPGCSYLVGYVNTWNALGCLAGAISGVFLLIPLLGAEWSLKLIIFAALAVGLVFAWRENPAAKAVIRAGLGIAVVLVYALLIKWDHRLLASGLNVFFGQPSSSTPASPSSPQPREESEKLVFFREDVQGGMTSVVQISRRDAGTEKILLTNGKYEGTDNLTNQGRAQIGFAAIPSLYTAEFGRALLIGLGTGHSALALDRMGYRDVDIAEFAPGIIDASRKQFSHLTEGVLDFPNVHLKVEDGRNVLLTNPNQKYDLITVEITSIWFAGATNVYSREFYDLARKRLQPGGVLQQWLQFHHISPREIESVVATVRSIFPYVSVWFTGDQGMIVATAEPQSPVAGREAQLTERMRLLIKADREQQDQVAHDIFTARVLNPASVDRMLAAIPAVINTDHNRWLEYATPQYNVSAVDWTSRNLLFLRGFE